MFFYKMIVPLQRLFASNLDDKNSLFISVHNNMPYESPCLRKHRERSCHLYGPWFRATREAAESFADSNQYAHTWAVCDPHSRPAADANIERDPDTDFHRDRPRL